MSLLLENPIQPMLKMPSDLALWQRCEQLAIPQVQWQIYLHQLAWDTLKPWFKRELSEYLTDAKVSLWPKREPWDIWQVVDGLAINLGQKRIVVILSEAIDSAALQVPQEWVDLPNWTADYYLAARLDTDNQQLVLWGYTNRELLKQHGIYDANERTYSLLEDHLIKDLSTFWVAQQVEVLTPVQVSSPTPVPGAIAHQLLQKLIPKADPRLEIPFDQWGALISNDRWLKGLYQQRQQRKTQATNLGNWIKQAAAQTVETLQTLSPDHKASGWKSLLSLSTQMSVASRSSTHSSVAGTSAKGKTISLKTSTQLVELTLAVLVSTEANERRSIRIQLHPSDVTGGNLEAAKMQELLLPKDVSLSLNIPSEEAPLQLVSSGEQDNYIQLPPFQCDAKKQFSIRIQLSDKIVIENFIS